MRAHPHIAKRDHRGGGSAGRLHFESSDWRGVRVYLCPREFEQPPMSVPSAPGHSKGAMTWSQVTVTRMTHGGAHLEKWWRPRLKRPAARTDELEQPRLSCVSTKRADSRWPEQCYMCQFATTDRQAAFAAGETGHHPRDNPGFGALVDLVEVKCGSSRSGGIIL